MIAAQASDTKIMKKHVKRWEPFINQKGHQADDQQDFLRKFGGGI
jgi:hypothetical protein